MTYPPPEIAARYPFVLYEAKRRPPGEMAARAQEFLSEMATRRSVRQFSDEPVDRALIDAAIRTAGTAPSGAHQQPWTWVVIGDDEIKRQIRAAAEAEEQANYAGRMSEEWRRDLEPLGTTAVKEYLTTAPWLVVVFEQRYGFFADGSRKHHYYVRESVGIACGLFIAALHHMGLATLTHTPSPMVFLSKILGRPAHERPMILFPIGYPAPDAVVPDLRRKPLEELVVEPDSPAADGSSARG